MTRWIAAVVTAASVGFAVSAVAGQAARGERWETTSQMSMPGMPMAMPARTAKVCAAKDWKEPPGGQKNCKNTNMQVNGNKLTWDAHAPVRR